MEVSSRSCDESSAETAGHGAAGDGGSGGGDGGEQTNAPSTNDVETYFRQATQLEPEFADHFLDFARFVYDDDHARESEARRIIEIGLEGDLEDGERAKLEDGLSKFNEFVTSTKASRDEL